MNTTENNRKLAEFMQPSFNGFGTYDFDGKLLTIEDLKFHNDWNWLIQVVEKIETVETKDGRTFTIDMHKDNVVINQYGKYNNEIIITEGRGRLENLYNACVEFVEWWKQEQSDNTVINSTVIDEWVKDGFVGIEKMFGGKEKQNLKH